MKTSISLSVIIISTALGGCIGNVKLPQNSSEYRAGILKETSTNVIHDKYSLSRSYSSVTSNLEKIASKCLNVSFKHTSHNVVGRETSGYIAHYTPTIIVGKTHTEIHLQRRLEGSMHKLKEPEKGHYILVADIIRTGGKTDVEVFSGKPYGTTTAKAISNWVSGKNMSCPDLSKY